MIGDEHNSVTFKIHTFHQQSGQEEDGKTLAATGGSEICSALSVAVRFPVSQDIVVKFDRCVELGIATNNFHILSGDIGEIDKMADYLPQSGFIEQSFDHGVERIDTVMFDSFIPGDFAPCVVEFVWSEQRTHPCINAVADNTQGVVFHQFRNTASVSDCELLPGIVYSGIFPDSTFKFKNNQGETVYIEDSVGDPFFRASDLQLINDPVDIVIPFGIATLLPIGIGIIHKLNIKIFLSGIVAFDKKTVTDQLMNYFVGVIKIGCVHRIQLTDNPINFVGGDGVFSVASGEK